ncbi:hypothetical protein Tco_0246740 [Tanacetum coccineum]
MAYHDTYKKILDEIWKDNVMLDGKIVKEEEEAVKSIKGEALKEKDDPGAFIFPIRLEGQVNENALAYTGSDINTMPYQIYKQLGRKEMKKVDRGITMINHTQSEAMGILTNVLYCDSYDEEEYQIKRNKFRAPIYGSKSAPYLNFSFLGSLPIPLKHVNWKLDYKGCYTKEEEATGQWRTEIRLIDLLWEHTMMRPDHQDPNALDKMKPWKRYYYHKFTMSSCYGKDVAEMQSLEIDDMLRIRMRETGSNEEIFTSVAWIRAFNINEPIYVELCHEFYSTYEFDEVYADDELQTKKIIKFRLGGCAHSLTLLEFVRRLGLYQAIELDKEGFNVYFKGGLRSDEHFNTREYWLSISREENLGLSMSHTSTIRNPILRMIHKMITYGLCQRTTGKKLALKRKVKFAMDSLSRRLLGVQGVDKGCGKEFECSDLLPPRASIQDLYDRMGRMEIRQEAIERMEYRQSYHWDRYQGVFKHMAGVYSVLLSGAYNPPGYAQPQYDKYY